MSSDLKDVIEIQELNKELGYEMGKDEVLERIKYFINNDINKMWSAKINNKVIGFITVNIIEQFQSGKSLRIDSLVVNQNYRRLGIGKRLIEFVERYAKEMNCNEIFLSSNNRRNEAHIFYQNMGYINNSKYFSKNI